MGHQLTDELESLSQQPERQDANPGDVPSRPIGARNQLQAHGITSGDEYDRYGRGHRLGGKRSGAGHRNQHSDRTTEKVGSHLRQSIEATIGPTVFDRDRLAFDKALLAQAAT